MRAPMAQNENQRPAPHDTLAADESSATKRDRTTDLERRIIQSYAWTLRAPTDADGRRAVTLSRHGPYEVRLVEPGCAADSEPIPFRIELFDHARNIRVDGYAGDDVEDVACAAEALMTWAQLLCGAVSE
jgi:hypothetical protein